MGPKVLFVSCAMFLYAFSPPGFLPPIPGEPQSLYIAGGLFLIGPMLMGAWR
jgi:hypothetical protein